MVVHPPQGVEAILRLVHHHDPAGRVGAGVRVELVEEIVGGGEKVDLVRGDESPHGERIAPDLLDRLPVEFGVSP
jgi:hypothetical protein